METRFTREMGLTRDEFLRCLPRALGHSHYRVDGERISIDDPAGPIEIFLRTGAERRIALLRLPVTRVEFRFDRFPAADRERFMARFERYFQRGGG